MALASRIRPVTEADLGAIASIYAYYVEHTFVTFDLEVPAVEDWETGWRAARGDGHPWLVTELEGSVVGYVKTSAFRPKPAYRSTIETTIYLDRQTVGRGFGRPLYEAALLEASRSFHVAVAGIALPNPGSVALHEALGFERVGVFAQVGHKLGAWRDVEWWQRLL